VDSQYNLALALLKEEQLEPAADHLQKAIELHSNLFLAWYYLGRTRAEQGRLEEAVDGYRQALSIAPGHFRSYAAIRESLTALGRSSEAARFSRHASALAAARAAGTTIAQTPPETPPGTNGAPPEPSLAPIPAPDLQRLEAAVAQQIQALLDTLDAQLTADQVEAADLGELYGLLGQVLHAYGFLEPAVLCYQNAGALLPDDFRWPHLHGVLQVQAGDLPQAVQSFVAACTLEPDYEPSATRLGNALLELNRLDQARQQFGEALQLDPQSVAALHGLGTTALTSQQHAEAATLFERVLAAAPGADCVHYSLAMAYRGLGRLDEAEQQLELRGSVGVRPADPLVDELQQLAQGERLFLLRGRMAFNARRYDEAEALFAQAVAAQPDSARARVNLGTALAQLDRQDEAIVEFEAAPTLDPENFAANFNLGALALGREAYDEAVDRLADAVDARPLDPEANRLYALALRRAGRNAELLEQLRRMYQAAPDDEWTILQLAEWLTADQQNPNVAKKTEYDGLPRPSFFVRNANPGLVPRIHIACDLAEECPQRFHASIDGLGRPSYRRNMQLRRKPGGLRDPGFGGRRGAAPHGDDPCTGAFPGNVHG